MKIDGFYKQCRTTLVIILLLIFMNDIEKKFQLILMMFLANVSRIYSCHSEMINYSNV